MYLFIFEDGEIRVSRSVTEEDRLSCDNGTLTIIDISGCTKPAEYHNREWLGLKEIDDES